ncbi:MAG: hypothetical protein ABJC79_09050 [Acidimicrobiia bacterium]
MIHRLEFTDDALHGVVVLEVPVEGLVRFDARFEGRAVGPGLIVVRDAEVPRARGTALEFRADGLWVEFVCETPKEHWSFGLEAFGLRVDDPAEEIGERIPVGFDLEWETPDIVHGELLVGRTAIAVQATGTFQLAS